MEGFISPVDFMDSTFEDDFIRWNQVYPEPIDANTKFHDSSELTVTGAIGNSLSGNAINMLGFFFKKNQALSTDRF